VACAPGEYHELGPLALTVMWRQAGLRAIYLGPDVAEDALVSEARAHRPALVCLSAATEAATKAIARAAAAFARIDTPRPIFGFGGAAFARTPQLQGRVRDGALFLGSDAPTATRHVFQLLQDGPIDGPAHRRS
jgi:cobalamin-dependent methionine synthase I